MRMKADYTRCAELCSRRPIMRENNREHHDMILERAPCQCAIVYGTCTFFTDEAGTPATK